jgi:hypothetical protein
VGCSRKCCCEIIGYCGNCIIKGIMHFKNLIQKRNEKSWERKRNLELEMREKIRSGLTIAKSADPNQTTSQDAISLVVEKPEVAQITYP